jgi:uncharacterized protein (TIGR03435 family)
MRTEWTKRALVGRVALMAGIAIGLSMVPHGTAFAQGPVFEVSLVPGAKTGGHMTISRTPQRIAFQATQVGDIIAFAYGFPLDRVERRPQWMYDDVYNVAATTAAPASLPEQKLMLQKLLEERFGLMVHRVSSEGTVYFLVASGAKARLTETKEADSDDIPQFSTGRPLQLSAAQPGSSLLTANHVSMSDLAEWLYSQMRLPVFDKTGITGLYDIELTLPTRGGAEPTIRAVRDQLGLDLQLGRGPAEMLIIDHAEKPREN